MENLIIFLQSYILEMLIIFTGIVALYGWSTRNKLISLIDTIKEVDSTHNENYRVIKDSLKAKREDISDLLTVITKFQTHHRTNLKFLEDVVYELEKKFDGHLANDFQCVKNKLNSKLETVEEMVKREENKTRLPSGSFKPGGEVYAAVHEFVRTHRGLNPMLVTDMVHVTQYTEQQCNKAVSEMIKRGLIVTEGNRRSRKLFPAID